MIIKSKKTPFAGQTRIKRKFFLFPKKLFCDEDNEEYWIWLECVNVVQYFQKCLFLDESIVISFWKDKRFSKKRTALLTEYEVARLYEK